MAARKTKSATAKKARAKTVTSRRRPNGDGGTVPAKRLSAIETARRHGKLIRMKLRGQKTDAEIAAELGMTERALQYAWQNWRHEQKALLQKEDPLDVIFEHIVGFKELRALAFQVFDEAAGTQIQTENEAAPEVFVGGSPSVRLGALKVLMDLRAKEISLRQETGLLPRDLGQLSIAVDVRWWSEQIVALLLKHNVGEEIISELITLSDQATGKSDSDDAVDGTAVELEDGDEDGDED